MEWSKLKNIIILILLLVNGFLLFMVRAQERDSEQYREQTVTDTVSVLERNGIRIDRSLIPEELDLTPMTVERDQEAEAALAAALLGECESSDLGSGRHAYQGSGGWAEFRSNGSFSIAFRTQTWTAPDGGEEEHALKLMEQVGLTGELVSRQESGGRVTLTLRQIWQKAPVYSCQITLEYEDGSLRSAAGQRLMGTPQPSGEADELISVPTALLRVLNGVNDLGDLCNEITSMTPGYLLTVSADATRLIPMWYVTTDTGAYSLNALTGALERA